MPTITKEQYRYERKYRPKSWEQMIGQTDAKRDIQNALSRPETKHFLFKGPPGTGKTTAGEIIARQLKYDYAEFNASNSRKLDDIRNIIIPALKKATKTVILMDEADKMLNDSQSALRRPLEKTKNTIVIFCVNKPHKIIDAIKSRCINITFSRLKDKEVMEGIKRVLKGEPIKFIYKTPEEWAKINKGLIYLVKSSKGDMRTAFNTLEKLINKNKQITVENIISLIPPNHAINAIQTAINGNFEKGKNMMYDAYILSGSHETILDEIHENINKLEIKSNEIHIKIYEALGELEHRLTIGSDPKIQLSWFISQCYIYPHVDKECPLLKKTIGGVA